MRKWRFRTSVVNQLSTECKQQVTQLMEPEAKARPTAGVIFSGAWIGMDPRLTSNFTLYLVSKTNKLFCAPTSTFYDSISFFKYINVILTQCS